MGKQGATPPGYRWKDARFVHRVNSQAAVSAFVAGPPAVAEGDVVMGKALHRAGRRCAVMAHPPGDSSDLTFEEWVGALGKVGRPIKVDIKTPDVIDEVTEVLMGNGFPTGQLILNADVVQGPGGADSKVECGDLIAIREAVGGGLVSIGSTTDPNGGPYTKSHVESLMHAADAVGGAVTVCLRLELILADLTAFEALQEEGFHLTFWNDMSTCPADEEVYRRLRSLAPDAFIDLTDAEGQPVWSD